MAVRDFDFQNNLFIDDSKAAQRTRTQKNRFKSLQLEEKKTTSAKKKNTPFDRNPKNGNKKSSLKMPLIISAVIIFATASTIIGAFSKQYQENCNNLKNVYSKEKRLKSIDQKISSVLSQSVEALQKGNKTEALLLLEGIPAAYENEKNLINEDYAAAQRMKADLLVAGILQSTAQKLSPTKEPVKENNLNKQWDILERKLMNMRKTYSKAQEYFSNGDFDSAKRNYLNVLAEFEEIENASNQLLKIEKKANNQQAKPFYDKAMELLKVTGNEKKAAAALSQMLTIAPLSDYTEFAAKKLEELVKIPNFSPAAQNIDNTNQNIDSTHAEDFKNAADKAMQKNHYAQARTLYASAINQANDEKIIKECTQGIIRATENELSNKHYRDFMKHCGLFRNALNKKDYAAARKEYFNALENAFAPYMDNSLSEFITAENLFMQSFEKHNDNPGLDEIRQAMKAEYQQELKLQEEQLRIKFSKQIEDLNNEIKDLSNEIENLNNQKEILINAYETQLELQKSDAEKAIINIAKGRLRERREKQEIIDKLENELKSKNEKIVSLKQDLKDLEVDSAKRLSEQSSKLQHTIDELTENLSVTEKKRANIQNSLNQQKLQIEKLQDSLAAYENELANLKNDSQKKDKTITEKNDEIAALEKNIEGLKVEIEAQELFYKKALGKADYNQKVLENKYTSLQQKQVALLDDQEALQKNLEQAKMQNTQLAQEIETWKYKYEKFPEELEQRYNDQLEKEKFKLRSQYNEKLNKIEDDVAEGKQSDLSGIKQIAKIIEILNDSITFQFSNQNVSSAIKKGDRLNVLRDLGGNLISIGTLKVTNISPFSTFGRADIEKLTAGMSLHTGDILIIDE